MAMAVKELSFVEVMSATQDLADYILVSEEMKAYLETKQALANDSLAQKKIAQFQKQKERYEEVQRFGKYHPDYKETSKQVRQMRLDLLMIPSVQAFKKAEKEMEELLYHVSRSIANGVSESIKVPSDNPLYNVGGGCGTGGCGTGGSCGCSK